MSWPGAGVGYATGTLGGAAAGAAVGGPPGAIIGGTIGGIAGGTSGYNAGKDKGGMSKFGAKRSKKAMKAVGRQEIRQAKKLGPIGRSEQKKMARQQMDTNEEWIRRQQKIHPEALENQRKYQNRAGKKQIRANARLAKQEGQKGFEQSQRNQGYGQQLHKAGRSFRNENAAEQRELFEKYGMPKKYENEKFFKKSLLNKEQEKNLNFQNKQGRNQKSYRDIAKNPLFQQGKSALTNQLNDINSGTNAWQKPYLENFQRNILPGAISNAGVPGQATGARTRARITASQGYGNQIDMMKQGLMDRLHQNILQYSGAETASRQQEIQNSQHNAQIGLGTKAFERLHRPSLYATPQGGNVSGGGQFNAASAQPSFAGVGQAQYSGLNTPNVNIGGGGGNYGQFYNQQQDNGNPGLNSFLSGAGQGAGTAAANFATNYAANKFGGAPASTGLPAQQNWGMGQGGFSGGGGFS